MRKKIEWEWEILDETTSRAKVIAGWILHHTISDGNSKTLTRSESMVFIPDRDHEWHIVQRIVNLPPPKANKEADDFGVPVSSAN